MLISIYRKYLSYFERPCSHGMAMKTWRHERIIKWRYDPRTCWTILSNCLMNLKIFHFISNTALHITFLSYERIILCICDQQVSFGQIMFSSPNKIFPARWKCWYVEIVSLCLKNREICAKLQRLTSLLAIKVYCEIGIALWSQEYEVRYKSRGNAIKLSPPHTAIRWRSWNPLCIKQGSAYQQLIHASLAFPFAWSCFYQKAWLDYDFNVLIIEAIMKSSFQMLKGSQYNNNTPICKSNLYQSSTGQYWLLKI